MKYPCSNQTTSRLAIIVALVIPLLTAGCMYYTRHTPDEVRQALTNAHLVGSTPEEAIIRLRQIRLAGGQELNVGQYTPDFSIIEASVENAKRTLLTRWSIDVVVTFDSTRRASHFDVRYSAVNPM